MKIAVVHYHLFPGGVSTVIRSASRALTESSIRHVILVGDGADDDLPCQIVEGLGYISSPTTLTAKTLLANLRGAAQRELGCQPDIWHFHNHSLGKNILMAEVVDLLATQGERLVLQLHDLAEDGRPRNYPLIADTTTLYPASSRVRYAFINSRDHRVFMDATLPASETILLPNPIARHRPSLPPVGSSLVLYPSRAIRRKNIGEILLLSLLAPAGTRFAITRAPENPAARVIHDFWEEFAKDRQLPVEFNVVSRLSPGETDGCSYETWVARATHFITTSVAEGFGLNFLESAAYGRPLIGRNLPDVTNDHPFPIGTLYDRILVPTEWLAHGCLRRAIVRDLTETYALYRQPLSPQAIDETFGPLHQNGYLDFGNLPEALQQQVILRVIADGAELLIESQGSARSGREWLADALGQAAPSPDLSGFSIQSYGEKLAALYDDLMRQPNSPVRYLAPDKILRSYLAPAHFHFLLTSPPGRRDIQTSETSPIRAVIFDIYGTLLVAPPGGFKPDPTFDPTLTSILRSFGHESPPSPTMAIHELIQRHHSSSPHTHPEIDLRALLQEFLGTDPETDLAPLVQAIEDARISCEPMAGAAETLRALDAHGIHLGVLSNGQANTLPALDRALGGVTELLDPDITLLSYEHLMAKPSPGLFELLTHRLATLGISPDETLFVGNDPLQDIVPATTAGFRTALFVGHPVSHRPGECHPDLLLQSLPEILTATSSSQSKP